VSAGALAKITDGAEQKSALKKQSTNLASYSFAMAMDSTGSGSESSKKNAPWAPQL